MYGRCSREIHKKELACLFLICDKSAIKWIQFCITSPCSLARQSSICVDANVLLSAALSSCRRSSERRFLHDVISAKLSFFMPAQGTVRAVQSPSLSVHFRPNNRDEQKSPQQTMLSEICLPNRRELLSALVIEMVIKTSFNQSTIGQKRNRKKCAGEDFPTSSILPSFLSDSCLVYSAPRALRSLFRSSRQFERWYLICRWKETSEPINASRNCYESFTNFPSLSGRFSCFLRPMIELLSPHWLSRQKLLLVRSKLFRSRSLVRGLGIAPAIVRLACDFYAHTFDLRQKNCKFMSSNLTLVPTNFSFLFVVLCPIKISLWHISLHRRRCRMTNNLFGLAFFAQCERLSLG